MSIKGKLHRILSESVELTEDELFEQAIDNELDSAFNNVVDDEPIQPEDSELEKTPEEQLDDLVPELAAVFIDKTGNDEKDTGKIKVFLQIYKSKIMGDEETPPIPVDQVIRHMKKHFNLDAELQAKVEKIFRQMAGDEIEEPAPNPLVEEAKKYLECIAPTLALSFRPAGGIESPEFIDRTKDLTSRYIDRVNGQNVEINAALNEMRALFDLDEEMSRKVESIFKVAKGSLDESSLAFIKENIGGTVDDGASDTMVEPAGDPMADINADVTEPETGNDQPMSTETPSVAEDPPESTVQPTENDGKSVAFDEDVSAKPGFYSEYKTIFETFESLADQINVSGALKEQENDGFDYTHILETLNKAGTVAMKHGATKYPKETVLEQIMAALHEDFEMDQELNESISNAIRHAYEIGNNYNEEYLRNSDLYNECKAVDVTVSMNEIVDLFADTPDEEEIIDINDNDDTIEKEENSLNEEINFNSLYNRKIQENF